MHVLGGVVDEQSTASKLFRLGLFAFGMRETTMRAQHVLVNGDHLTGSELTIVETTNGSRIGGAKRNASAATLLLGEMTSSTRNALARGGALVFRKDGAREIMAPRFTQQLLNILLVSMTKLLMPKKELFPRGSEILIGLMGKVEMSLKMRRLG